MCHGVVVGRGRAAGAGLFVQAVQPFGEEAGAPLADQRPPVAARAVGAPAEWARIYPLMGAIMSAPFIPAVKAALEAAGFPVGRPREPLLALDAAATTTIASLVRALPQLPEGSR
ncbi:MULTISPECIES: hypothetical protein [unclassified Streptomyces]|uniref:hypothetical protein n=1 Tax=unclassified Streptomyces TaxID=2593676 RepID=UPI0020360E58|nr:MULTISPECIES: hypothetical protein [unclassified Streptomyces]